MYRPVRRVAADSRYFRLGKLVHVTRRTQVVHRPTLMNMKYSVCFFKQTAPEAKGNCAQNIVGSG